MDKFDWIRVNGYILIYGIGFFRDYIRGIVSGYYMFIEFLFFRRRGDKARFFSFFFRVVFLNSNFCFVSKMVLKYDDKFLLFVNVICIFLGDV